MMSSYMNSSGSCYLPQLPPLPPPPFANQIQPNYWPPFNGSPFLPPPPPAAVPHGHHSYQAGGTVSLLPSPLYGNSKAATYRGKGRRGNGGSGKWKIQKCETCDRVYKSEETFAEHMQSHVKVLACMPLLLPLQLCILHTSFTYYNATKNLQKVLLSLILFFTICFVYVYNVNHCNHHYCDMR